MEMLSDDSRIVVIPVMEHYEAYLDGKFIVSADTRREIYNELQKIGGTY